MLSEGQSFSSYDHQFVARGAWVPILEEEGTLLHVALAGRYGLVNDRTLRLRSPPEVNLAPYFVETESFAAHDTRLLQGEVYYRPGPWVFGMEYFVQRVNALELPDPLFHGGDAVVSWLITGETRKYNTAGGYFLAVSPDRPVFEDGPGAWEAVLRLSYIDLDDAPSRGAVLAPYSHGELVSERSPEAGVRLRGRPARSVRAARDHAVPSEPRAVPVLRISSLMRGPLKRQKLKIN